MIFIFGWGDQKVKSYGPTEEYLCQRCNNRTFWHLYSTSSWVTLFFIPVFRLKKKFFEQCEICQNSRPLEGENVEIAMELTHLNRSASASDMTEEDYQSAKQKIKKVQKFTDSAH